MTEENTGGARSDAGSPAPLSLARLIELLGEYNENRRVDLTLDSPVVSFTVTKADQLAQYVAALISMDLLTVAAPKPQRRTWRGEQALAGPRPAIKTWQGGIVRPGDTEPEEPDLIGYLSRCDCGQRALTRTQHEVWSCPECASSSAGPEWETNVYATRLEVPEGMTPEEFIAAHSWQPSPFLHPGEPVPRPVRHAFCSETTKHDCTGYHCARCGRECGPEGHQICATDAPPANTIRPETEG